MSRRKSIDPKILEAAKSFDAHEFAETEVDPFGWTAFEPELVYL